MELETLVDRYGNALLRAALAILGDPYEAEDAVQDAFLRWLEKRPAFRDEGHQRAWLLTVTANGCKSRLRARKRHPTQELLDVYPAPDSASREVAEAVLTLPPAQRAAVRLTSARQATCFTMRDIPPRRLPAASAGGRGRCAPT